VGLAQENDDFSSPFLHLLLRLLLKRHNKDVHMPEKSVINMI